MENGKLTVIMIMIVIAFFGGYYFLELLLPT